MGPVECHESITGRIYEDLTEKNLNPLDLFKKGTLRIIGRVVSRGERIWEEDSRKNFTAFRKLLGKALDRKDDHDRRCRGDDGECLDQQVKGFHRDLGDHSLNPLDLMQPTTLMILEKVTRRYASVWENEDRKSFKIFRNMLWNALERHAEEASNCHDDDELMDELGELRDQIQSGVS